ncbi:MAG: polysaccharide deacetylase family protein [Acidimicrobiales bacterium]|nr:polysaccharide deacetylase family protein [Acidimicrobiales bacterium]
MSRRVLIFGWHNVESTWCFPSSSGAGPTGMRHQFEALARVANVIDLPEAVRGLRGDTPLPPRAAVITFDDGYRDNLDLAAPLLSGMGLPATFFLCPDILSGAVEPWWERLGQAFTTTERLHLTWQQQSLGLTGPEARDLAFARVSKDVKGLDEPGRQAAVDGLVDQLLPGPSDRPPVAMLDWDGARELARQGFTIGSHSSRHVILANEEPEAQQEDLAGARHRLEAGIGVHVDLLAYPNGTESDFDSATVRAAVEAGYQAAVTTVPGWNGPGTSLWELRRFVMYPEWDWKGLGVVPRHAARVMKGRVLSR